MHHSGKTIIIILKFMYTMTTSEVQNYLTTDFMPVKVNANADANRGVYVFMVTSGGSGYPNGTFYFTKNLEVMVLVMQKQN